MKPIRNWRTTLAGFVIGGAYATLAALSHGMTPKDAAIAGGFAILGMLAKDWNVTGGSVQQ